MYDDDDNGLYLNFKKKRLVVYFISNQKQLFWTFISSA